MALNERQQTRFDRLQRRKAAGKPLGANQKTHLQNLKAKNRMGTRPGNAPGEGDSTGGMQHGENPYSPQYPPGGTDVYQPQGVSHFQVPEQGAGGFQGSGTNYAQQALQNAYSQSTNPFMDMMGLGGGWNDPYSPMTQQQQNKLGNIENRIEKGKGYNEDKYAKLLDMQKMDARFNKFMAKMPDKFINAYGGPGQEQAGTATAGWYGGLTPEQQQQVAAFAFANKAPQGGDPYATTPTGSPRTWGNMMNSVFPGLKDTYSGSLHGMTGEEWGALTPQQMQKIRMERRRGTTAPAPAPAPAPDAQAETQPAPGLEGLLSNSAYQINPMANYQMLLRKLGL